MTQPCDIPKSSLEYRLWAANANLDMANGAMELLVKENSGLHKQLAKLHLNAVGVLEVFAIASMEAVDRGSLLISKPTWKQLGETVAELTGRTKEDMADKMIILDWAREYFQRAGTLFEEG